MFALSVDIPRSFSRSASGDVIEATERDHASQLSQPSAGFLDSDRFEEIRRDGRPILIVGTFPRDHKDGVSTLIRNLQEQVSRLTEGGVEVRLVTPWEVPSIRISKERLPRIPVLGRRAIGHLIDQMNPQSVHLMAETPLGGPAQRALRRRGMSFTTAYTTKLPEYARASVEVHAKPLGGFAERFVAARLLRFHRSSSGIMVATRSLTEQLIDRGFDPFRIRAWSRGVDSEFFHPSKADPTLFANLKGPISVYVGRVAAEKNVEDFLAMDVPGTKVLVGDGPPLKDLQRRFPDAVFVGSKPPAEVARYLASANLFVITSLAETFGQVMLEANASGLPVVAYDVSGPRDVIAAPQAGVLARYDPNDPAGNERRLEEAWHQAAKLPKECARAWAEHWTWERTALEFLQHLVPASSSEISH